MANKNISGDVNVEFTEAQSRQSLESGESVKTLFGKLRKWLTDLKAVAFSGSYNDLSNKPSIPSTEVTETLDTTPYLYKTSEHDAVYDELVGGSVAWNQLVPNGNFESTSGWTGRYSTVSVSNNICTVTPSNAGTLRGLIGSETTETVSQNHKLLLSVYVLSPITTDVGLSLNGDNQKTISVTANVWKKCECVWTNNADTPKRLYAIIMGNLTTSQIIQYKNAFIIDLTQMFGSTIADYAYNLEQSTVGSGIAWLKSYGFFTKDYYAYNAGGLVSVNTSGKRVVGKNLLDASQIVVGSIGGQGQDISSNTRLRTAYIPVLPNTTYTAISGNSVQIYEYHEYRTDKSHIKFVSINATSGSNTMSPDTHFIRLLFRYSDNRIMEVSDMPNPQLELGSTATDYEPYTSITYPIQSADLRGLYKLDANNKLYTDGDIYSADGTVTIKYGYRGYQSGDESLANAITDGTYTIYKLSAPTTVTASSFSSPQMVYRNGTEEYLDTRDVPMPVGGNRKYVDIPEWMINEYFDDMRADSSIIDGIKKEADTLEEHLKAFIIESNIGNPTRINNASDFTVELFDKIWGTNTDLYPRFAHLFLFGNEAHFLKAIIESVDIYTPTTHTSEKLIQATFISEMSMYYFRWVRGQAPSMNKYTISVT